MSHHYRRILFAIAMLCAPWYLHAQEQDSVVIETTKTYLESRTALLDKYLQRSQEIQDKLLKKLKKKTLPVALLQRQRDLLLYAPHKIL